MSNTMPSLLLFYPSKMLVQVRYCQQQKYVKLEEVDGRFEFMQFHEKGLFISYLILVGGTEFFVGRFAKSLESYSGVSL